MSVTPAPRAISPSVANGRSVTVPSEKTVSMCPIRSTLGPAGSRPRNVPMTVSPYLPVGSTRRSTPPPRSANAAAIHAATRFTPAGE